MLGFGPWFMRENRMKASPRRSKNTWNGGRVKRVGGGRERWREGGGRRVVGGTSEGGRGGVI